MEESVELALRANGNPGGLITEAEAKLTLEDIQTIKTAIFKGAEESELKLFLHDCQRQGVHPLDRLIHPTIRTDKSGKRTYTAITSIDLFRSRAEDTGFYAGNDDPVFSGTPKGDDFKATVTVYKIVHGVRCPFTATARWSEYKPAPPNDFMWNKMPCGQLGKCAEALALRKAFPRQLSKLYVHEEMEQANNPPQDQHESAPTPAPAKPTKAKPKRDGDDAEKVPTIVVDASEPGEPGSDAQVSRPEGCFRTAVLKVQVKNGEKKDKTPWTRTGIEMRDEAGAAFWANTFSTTDGAIAKKCLEGGLDAWVKTIKNGEYLDLAYIEAVEG
jgi:phage recombination protein Bet